MSVAPTLTHVGSLGDHATIYAAAGLEIFPVKPDKTPYSSQYKATTDVEQVKAWWRQWPDALIGHRISPDHVVLDIDPRHGGMDVWRAIKTEFDVQPVTRWHRSGRGDGGGHTWWLRPADKLTVTKLDAWAKERGLGHDLGTRWTCGIDILHHNHRYTILPPSPHPDTGKPYNWAGGGHEQPVAPMPALLADLITNDLPVAPPAPSRAPDPDSIADWYTANNSWTDLLVRHGWTLRAGEGNTDGSRWRHPTATASFSATIRHGCLFVYSPNTRFEVTNPSEPHGYTIFRAYATLEHQGDLSAAARAAREQRGDPTPTADLSWVTPTTSNGASDNGATDAPPEGRHVNLTIAASITPKRVRWCWSDRIAVGTIALLAGPEGLGKSTIGYWLAARITRGELPGEYDDQPKAALVCATEDSWEHTIVPRLMAHGADLEQVYRVEVREGDDELDLGLSLPRDLTGVEHAALSVDAALLILDPLMSRLASNLDTHRDGEVRRALEPLAALAETTRMAILGLIHHNKSGSADPLQLVMASKAFTAVARSVHTVIRDPDDEAQLRRFFGTSKNNLGRLDLPTLAFTIQGWEYQTDDGPGFTGQIVWGEELNESIADALTRLSQDPADKTALDEACEWLDEYITAHGPTVLARDAKNAGKNASVSERTLERARKRLRIESRRDGFAGPFMWSKPVSPSSPQPPQDPQHGEVGEVGEIQDLYSPKTTTSPTNTLPPRARRESESEPTGRCRCGAPATDLSGLCPGCLTNPGTLPPPDPSELF